MYLFRRCFFLILSLFWLSTSVQAKVEPVRYGLVFSDSIKQQVAHSEKVYLDSFWTTQPQFESKSAIWMISHPHGYQDDTTAFYLLLLLCLMLGMIRFTD